MICRFVPRIVASACVFVGLSLPIFSQSYGDLPLSFEPNVGQAESQVEFLSHGKGYQFSLSGDSAAMQFGVDGQRLQLTVANGFKPTSVSGEHRLPGAVNYFRGSDQSRWLRSVPTYSRVRLSAVYNAIDLVYYGNHRQLEYDFVVHPGGDPAQVGLTETGADSLTLTSDGGLSMRAGKTTLHWHAPVAYQEFDGRRHNVAARYQITGSTMRFRVGAYDHRHDLIIDPSLVYSTYLGGNGGDMGDVGNAIAADSAGNVYVAGMAASTDFPTTGNALQTSPQGWDDAFVAKLNPQGTAFVYSTYLGGGGQDIAWAIAVDGDGAAYVTGQTGSGLNGTSAFPTTAGAFQRSHNPNVYNNSVFVTKLSADGSQLLYSTLISGANDSFASGIDVDSSGAAYVLTNTAGGFPTTNGAYQRNGGNDNCPYAQFADGQAQVVSKLGPQGGALQYSTYIGHGCDYGAGIAVNANGEAYITGHTQDAAYPVTAGAAQTNFGGVVDAFVTHLNTSGTGLLYSTFLGGSLADFSYSIALDGSGYAYVAGGTDGDFPTTAGSYETTAVNNGIRKGFISKVAPLGRGLTYSTYIKGGGDVSFNGIAVDRGGAAYVTGYTDGKYYPTTTNSDQSTCFSASYGCLTQAVVTKLNPAGTGLLYSSYFGASDANNNYFPGNIGNAIATDGSGGFYITGRTSNGLRTTNSAVEPNYRANANSTDAFVAKFNASSSNLGTRVVIASPTGGSSAASPLKISGYASGSPVAWMQVYVDGVRHFQVAGNTVATTSVIAAGERKITLRAIGKDGAVAQKTVYVTVK